MTTAAAAGNAGGYRAPMYRCNTGRRFPTAAFVLCLVLVGFAGSSARADAELADFAARIAFGFYAADASVVRAAERQLERRSSQDERVRYLLALAAFRRAQLELAAQADADVGDLLERCIELVEPAEENRGKAPIRVSRVQDAATAEAWTLAAACAAYAAHLEPWRRAAHSRRRDSALEHARRADPGNPRVELVEAWAVSLTPAVAADDARAAVAQALEEALAAFAGYAAPSRRADDVLDADWGEAEALALLGEIRARDGARREARDLIERALLAAPDYAFAEALALTVRGGR